MVPANLTAIMLAVMQLGYQTQRSLRLRYPAAAFIQRTYGTPTNNTVWTFSTRFKLGILGQQMTIISAGSNSGNYTEVYIDSIGRLTYRVAYSSALESLIQSNQFFRDPSAHYDLTLTKNGTTITAKINGGNGVAGGFDITWAVSSSITSNDTFINSARQHCIGARSSVIGGGFTWDGLFSETRLVDGQVLPPTAFNQVDPVTGAWVSKKYTGTWGNNGTHLDYSDPASTTALMLDRSGNGNNWTATNVSLTAGSTYDSMLDVPLGGGGQERGNYATLNPLRPNGAGAFLNGNLSGTSESGTPRGLCSTIVLDRSGKWYCEVTPASSTTNWFGVTANDLLAADVNTAGQQSVMYYANGNKYVNGGGFAYGASFTTQTIGMAFDGPANTITFYRDNVSQGAITLPSSTVDYVFFIGNAAGGGVTNAINFGQRPFTYTPPSGFKALHTGNLTNTTPTTSGSFTGNLSADGPHIWCNGTPETLTINGNAVTWGTHADKLATGFKVRTASSSYNSSGTNTWTATYLSPSSKSAFKYQNAKGNP